MENSPMETCVICLRISQEDFKNLFACDACNTETYLSKIQTLLGLKVFDKYSLICSYCKEDLNVAYEFRERLVHAHEYWSNKERAVKQETDVNDSELDVIEQKPCFSAGQDNVALEENRLKLQRGIDEDTMTFAWKGLRCIKCEEIFRTAFVLSNHNCNSPKERKKECRQTKKYTCEYCNESFKWRQSFNNHLINKHSDARNFNCDACGKTFKIKASLTRHMEVHRPHRIQKPKEEPIVCNVCGKSYSKTSLRKHMMIHDDVKPHECHVCGRKFRQSDQLRVHLKTHTGEKPYGCGDLNTTLQKHIDSKHKREDMNFEGVAVI